MCVCGVKDIYRDMLHFITCIVKLYISLKVQCVRFGVMNLAEMEYKSSLFDLVYSQMKIRIVFLLPQNDPFIST